MTTAALAGLLVAAGLGQAARRQSAPAEKKYKDGEFDIYSAAANDVKGGNFAQAIKDLDTWKQKFAETDFKTERQTLYIMAYSGAQQFDKAVDAAAPMINAGVDTVFPDPKDGPGQAIRVLFAVATAALLNSPTGLAFDSAGNLYIADSSNHRIRKVSGGNITTVAGSGPVCLNPCNNGGFTGDGGPATSATMSYPWDVAFDSSDNMLIADSSNNRIRLVDANGNIRTVAGSGTTNGYSGDLGPATSALLSIPTGVAADNAGNFYIADNFNNVIRMVDGLGVISTIAGTIHNGFSGDGGPEIGRAHV